MLKMSSAALTECTQHLDATGNRGTAIESYLTRYILIEVYREMEQEVLGAIAARVQAITDQEARSYLLAAPPKPRDYTVRELGMFLERFGEDHRRVFLSASQADGCHVAYDNLLTNRHAAAHGEPSPGSFREVEEWIPKAARVLEAFSAELGSGR